MIVSRTDRQTLEQAAASIGVQADITPLSPQRHRVKLYPDRTNVGAREDAKYQRESVGYYTSGRRVNAVCWHGFRDYFREVFKTMPEAVFRTSVDTWRGFEDFEARYRESGWKNIGPPIAPVAMCVACRCPESGWAS